VIGGSSISHVIIIKLLGLIRMILVGTAESFSYSRVTVSIRIPVYWVGISFENVQVFRDLVKNP